MNYFKKTLLQILLLLIIPIAAVSQDNKTVALTVSAQGQTISEAKQNALRDAIEQAFGAFVSSNTEILNDELIKDEIVSVSNGNIQDYDVISEIELPKGGYATTLKATVSVTKLTSFAKSNGVKVEFKGGLFAANMIQQELNEKAEFKAVKNIIKASIEILKKSFDYSLDVADNPIIDHDNVYKVILTVKIKLNKNFDTFRKYFNTSMRQLSMSSKEIKSYSKTGKSFDLLLSYNKDNKKNPPQPVYFRNTKSLEQLNLFIAYFRELILDFNINNGVNNFDGHELMPQKRSDYITMIDLFRIYVIDYKYSYSAGKPTYGKPSPKAASPSLFHVSSGATSGPPVFNVERSDIKYLQENFILQPPQYWLNTSSKRYRIKRKNQREIITVDRSIILNFYNFYSDDFRNEVGTSLLKTTVPEEFLNEKSIIWISFYDTKTLDEIKQISEYTIEPIN